MRHIFPSLVALVAVGADAQNSAAYSIEWPDQWEVTSSPLPASSSGKQFAGGRVIATRYEDGSPAAVIGLMYMDVLPDESTDIDVQFATMLETVTDGFEKSGFSVEVKESTGRLGEFPARQARLTAVASEVVIVQWMSVAASDDISLAITFSGTEPKFEQYWDAFQATLESLVFR